jgi:Family of unknown function (DUF6169)
MLDDSSIKNYYDFEFQGGNDKSYFFETKNGYFYQIKFKESSYLFSPIKTISLNSFEFVIDLVYPQGNSKVILDSVIPYTIAAIFKDFFKLNGLGTVVYIIDSSDSRQSARKRKFDSWVELFKGDEYFKVDAEIIDLEKNKIYSSLIIKTDNPNFNEIIKYFGSLPSKYSK